jgi:hypothetical protein
MKRFAIAVAALAFFAAIWAGTAPASGNELSVAVSENAQYVSPFQIDIQVNVSCPATDFVIMQITVTEDTSLGSTAGITSNGNFCTGGNDKLAVPVPSFSPWQLGTALVHIIATDTTAGVMVQQDKYVKISL